MDITCWDCGARFRLDPALLKDSRAAYLRCRKCGGRIVVRLPEESPDPPVAGGSGAFRSEPASSPVHPPQETGPPPAVEAAAPAQEPVSPWPVEPSAPAQGPTVFEADISGMFRSEPASSLVHPPPETGPPPAVEAAAPAQEPVSPWPVEPSAPAQGPTAFEADISGAVTSEPLPSPQPEAAWPRTDTGQQEMHDPGTDDPVPSGMPGTVYSRLEDLFASPDKEAGPDRIPPPPEEYPAGENLAEETAITEPERKAPSRRASFTLKILVISALWILLLAGGALYFGTTKSGQDLLGELFAGWGSSRTGSSPARPVYDIRDVKWHVDKDSTAGNLFVIKGSVANIGNVQSAGIRIQATLLGKDNEALAVKAAFAGNLIDEASLGKMDREGIEGVMSTRFGEGNVNKEIPPGKALPFMVIFTDPPGQIETVMVKAVDAR